MVAIRDSMLLLLTRKWAREAPRRSDEIFLSRAFPFFFLLEALVCENVFRMLANIEIWEKYEGKKQARLTSEILFNPLRQCFAGELYQRENFKNSEETGRLKNLMKTILPWKIA